MKTVQYKYSLLFIVLFQTILILLLPKNWLGTVALINTLLLIFLAGRGMMSEIKAFHVALLGFGVMLFSDIFKEININHIDITNDHISVILWTYLSLAIFILTYSLRLPIYKFKGVNKKTKISTTKLLYIVTPVSLVFLAYFWYQVSFLGNSSAISTLISFLPKALSVVLLYLYISTSKKKNSLLLLLGFILLFLAFGERSRRVYITLLLILTPILMSRYYSFIVKSKVGFKVLLVSIFISSFIFMSSLRSDFDYGDGYIENNKLQSTLNYMSQMKAIYTFTNTAFVFENLPDKWDYYYGETYLAFFVQVIPRSMWHDKIVGFGAPLGLLRKGGIREFTNDDWLSEVNGYSDSPGFIGEAYANFGYAGIIIASLLFGYITRVYDYNVRMKDIVTNIEYLPYLSFYGSFFVLLRGDFVSAMFFSTLFYIFTKLIILSSKSKAAR